MAHCFKCGGHGFEDKVCESCGRQPKKLNLSKEDPKTVRLFLAKTKGLEIPEEYIGIDWSKEIFLRGRNNPSLAVKQFADRLEKVHDVFVSGNLPRMGAFIIAPGNHSKTVLAYSCMQHALKNGFSVGELLDTMELKRLMVLGAENPKYRLYNRISYDTYMISDVLFVTVTKTEYHKEAMVIARELIDLRSRKGLATFILSQWDLGEMSEWDKSGYLKEFVKDGFGSNRKKYVAVIHCPKER